MNGIEGETKVKRFSAHDSPSGRSDQDASLPRILVVGDAILDHYVIGRADRISPEAPIPILRWERDEYRLGGAAAVAAMVAALGTRVDLCTVLGNDGSAERVVAMLHQAGVGLDLILHSDSRITTRKTRVVGVASGGALQQMQRIDRECRQAITLEESTWMNEWIDRLRQEFSGERPWNCVLVSDYDKGVCAPHLIGGLLRLGPVIVDPPRTSSWRSRYVGRASCFVPNRQEAGCPADLEATRLAESLRESLTAEAVIIKLDASGCAFAQKGFSTEIPSVATAVIDVCGAGDQFLAALGCARANGETWQQACTFANHMAGLQCARFGCDPISKTEAIDAGVVVPISA